MSSWAKFNHNSPYKRETRESESERERFEDAVMLALKMEGAMNQEMQAASSS